MTGPESSEFIQDKKRVPQGPIPQRTFSLASLLLFVTLVAFLLGMIKWNLEAGVALVILSFPALIRTMAIANRMKTTGVVLSFGEKLLVFSRSFALVALIAGAAGGTFLAIGYPLVGASGLGIGMMFMGAVLAVGISGSIGATLIRLFWLPKE